MKRHRLMVLPAFFLMMAACSTQPPDPKPRAAESHAPAHGAPAADARPVLYDSLGRYSYPITTASAAAQRWFDQGLGLVYAFNHQEAQRAFREAARIDPTCAMCYWGIASPRACAPRARPPRQPRSTRAFARPGPRPTSP